MAIAKKKCQCGQLNMLDQKLIDLSAMFKSVMQKIHINRPPSLHIVH